MFISDKWKDYELCDASDGERLEKWRIDIPCLSCNAQCHNCPAGS